MISTAIRQRDLKNFSESQIQKMQDNIENSVTKEIDRQIYESFFNNFICQYETNIRPFLQEDLKRELENDIRKELEHNIRKELKGSVEVQLKKELRSDIETLLKKELKGSVETQLKKELRSDVEAQLKKEISGVQSNKIYSNFNERNKMQKKPHIPIDIINGVANNKLCRVSFSNK
jgi:hypothetical protein